ncbi:DNA mismatch endonuclease, patch repair protein [Sphingomonas rubra]|uniref:DNA mismatch endonuclease, patch repair protein n=1 Tax=Sphingomonas rubra TaxID=634430 RepID=A0A1I5RUP1_9SPHN|nr:DNA mismatch endonuclease, patch repair protein [Sphingomonas rubra]
MIFVHGCFWHSHDCPYGVRPASNADFWAAKLARNVERDAEQLAALAADEWRVTVVWECALKGRARRPIDEAADTIVKWLSGSSQTLAIAGAWPSATDGPLGDLRR